VESRLLRVVRQAKIVLAGRPGFKQNGIAARGPVDYNAGSIRGRTGYCIEEIATSRAAPAPRDDREG
jgi:hypothetical protein